MTEKEWIILIIPIVVNGLILYMFQLMISEKIKRNNAKKELIKSICERYLALTDTALKSYRETIKILLNSKDECEQDIISFNKSLGMLRDDVRNLQFYYEDYKIVLGDSEDLFKMYKQLDDMLIQQSSGDVNSEMKFLQNGERILQEILEITLTSMLKL